MKVYGVKLDVLAYVFYVVVWALISTSYHASFLPSSWNSGRLTTLSTTDHSLLFDVVAL